MMPSTAASVNLFCRSHKSETVLFNHMLAALNKGDRIYFQRQTLPCPLLSVYSLNAGQLLK